MSDYLGNLIARTVSPAVAVRPQLPSLFEPAPATREGKSEPEFEQENFVEQPPGTQPSEKVAPMPLLTPPSTSIDHQSTREPSRIFSSRGDGKPTPEPEVPVQTRIFRRAAQTLREDRPSNSIRRRSDVIKSPLRDAIASASHEVSAQEETGRSQPSVASKSVVVPEPNEPKLPKRSRVQAIVPTIRSLPPIPRLPATAATAPPTINVTIGRVEVRSVMPRVAVPKPTPKSASKLSLEDYLKQRNGETR